VTKHLPGPRTRDSPHRSTASAPQAKGAAEAWSSRVGRPPRGRVPTPGTSSWPYWKLPPLPWMRNVFVVQAQVEVFDVQAADL
jgi:hypothetical protein